MTEPIAAAAEGGVPAAEQPPGRRPRTPRDLVWPAIALTVLLVGPVLFLIVLLENLVSPAWASTMSLGTRQLLSDITPHVLVLVIGTLIGVAEVTSSFPHRGAAALMAPWGAALVLANALGTVIVYAAVTLYLPSGQHPILRPIAIALAFAILIRTRFVLARPLEQDSGSRLCSLDLGWPYGRCQQVCREQIRAWIGPDRRSDIAALRQRYPSSAELRRVGRWALERDSARAEAARLTAELDRLLAEDVPERLALDQAAGLILDGMSRDTLELALGGEA
jgi:hypothetical protein